MRRPLLAFLGALFVLLIFKFSSCTTDEPEPPNEDSTSVEPPAVLSRSIVGELSMVDTLSLEIFAYPRISFKEEIDSVVVIDLKNYRAIVDEVTIAGVDVILYWNSDRTAVDIVRDNLEAFDPGESYTVVVKAHWEHQEGETWKPVTWEGETIGESKSLTFTIPNADLAPFEEANILATYPISDQYHFLQKETEGGFILLKRGMAFLFEGGYEWKSVLTHNNSEVFSSSCTYVPESRRIQFDLPQTLEHEKIYTLDITARNTSTNVTVVVKTIHFRTSKFDRFMEKIGAITFGNAYVPIVLEGSPYKSRLKHQFTAAEYFDSFELEPAFEENGNASGKPYLISFVADLQNMSMYKQLWEPLVYAPWTDKDFNPVVKRDTSVLGYPPAKAMFLEQDTNIKLSEENIAANDAPAIEVSMMSSVTFAMQQIIYQDFYEIQRQVVERYLNQSNVAEREAKVLNTSFPRWNSGTYPYAIRYRLPDGTITSSLSFSVSW